MDIRLFLIPHSEYAIEVMNAHGLLCLIKLQRVFSSPLWDHSGLFVAVGCVLDPGVAQFRALPG